MPITISVLTNVKWKLIEVRKRGHGCPAGPWGVGIATPADWPDHPDVFPTFSASRRVRAGKHVHVRDSAHSFCLPSLLSLGLFQERRPWPSGHLGAQDPETRDGQNPTPPLCTVPPADPSPGPAHGRFGLPSTAHRVMRGEGDLRGLQRGAHPGQKGQTVPPVPRPPECLAMQAPRGAHTPLVNKSDCMCSYLTRKPSSSTSA